MVRPARLHARIGGLDRFAANRATRAWLAGPLRGVGFDGLTGAHCAGIEVVDPFRADFGLDRAHAVVGAVGAVFELGRGIDPRRIAR